MSSNLELSEMKGAEASGDSCRVLACIWWKGKAEILLALNGLCAFNWVVFTGKVCIKFSH